MLSRYIKITPLMKTTEPVDIEISGFRLFSGDALVDISNCTVRASFVPVNNNQAVFKRTEIIENEVFTIPASKVKGNGFIYLDLGTSKNFDSFQIGFSSTLEKSLTKLAIEYSTNGINYYSLALITDNVRLRYRNPWTYSGHTIDARTGFPAIINSSALVYQVYYETPEIRPFLSEDGLRFFNKRENPYYDPTHNTTQSTKFVIPISNYLRSGKYYFEVSSKSGMGGTGYDSCLFLAICVETKDSVTPGGTWADTVNSPQNGEILASPMAMFSLTTTHNGVRTPDANQSLSLSYTTKNGEEVPSSYNVNYPGGKKGLLAGFSIDIPNNTVTVTNSPFAPDFTFSYSLFLNALKRLPENNNKRIYFSIVSAENSSTASNLDLTFNFGQDPFVGPVPTGFDDRIGHRWELEIDPNFKFNVRPTALDEYLNIGYENILVPIEEQTQTTRKKKKNHILSPNLVYYIKGKISAVNGKFSKKTVELYNYPQMELASSTSSSTEDGTYEFLNLWNRSYLVISYDAFATDYEPEAHGPLKPTLMDPKL